MRQSVVMTDEEARERVERELRERLARQPAPSAADPPSGEETAREASLAAVIALRCVECHAICESDARFCTQCGVRFNARIVARELVRGSAGEASS